VINETAPPTSSWSELLEQLNVPKILAGPAGEALSRLVGQIVDFPSEHLKSLNQRTIDRREARSEVSKALAKAAAAEVITDQKLIHRAAQSFLAKELRSQSNKEAVAEIAIRHLKEAGDRHEDDSASPPDDDWLNIFEDYAEHASSERLRDLWGRVLAKEIRSPKSFSLRTMRLISELDADTAKKFQNISSRIFNDDMIPKGMDPFEGPLFDEYLHLQDAGLLVGVEGGIGQSNESQDPPPTHLVFSQIHAAVVVRSSRKMNINLDVMLLTKTAKELLRIIDRNDDPEYAQKFTNILNKSNIDRIDYGKLNINRDDIVDKRILWARETA